MARDARQGIATLDPAEGGALDEARRFHADTLPTIIEMLEGGADVLIVFPNASVDYDDWRRAAIRDLARAHAPSRINAVTSGMDDAIDEASTYLSGAPGVTGQYLPLHDHED